MKAKGKKRIVLICLLLAMCCLVCGCNEVCINHTDNNGDGTCDDCGETVKKVCQSHVDTDKDGFCDICRESVPVEGDNLSNSRVRFSAIPNGVSVYGGAQVRLGDTVLPLYAVKVNTSQVWTAYDYSRSDCGVGYFELEGQVTVTVKLPYTIDYSSKVRPLSANVIPIADIENSTLTFVLKSAGHYVLEVNGDKTKAIHLFVSDYEQTKEQTKEQFAQTANFIYFGAGVHTARNSQYIDQNNEVVLNSDTVVYIDDGAVVRARFYARNKQNITIYGRGIIDGSVFERNANTGARLIPIDFNYCSNVTLNGFSLLDPAGWTVNFYYIQDSKIENIKIITSRSNGDGISLQSCQRIDVSNCFVRSWDDSLVVKNYPEYTAGRPEGTTRDISFTDCVLWSDLAQSMEIGYETVGQTLCNVTFDNITVLHALHKPVISVHNANNADIRDITFSNITVEDLSTGGGDAGGNSELIDIRVLFSQNWSTNHKTTALGSIDGIEIANVLVLSGRALKITLGGCKDVREAYYGRISPVSNISISNLTYKGQNITADSEPLSMNTNQYVSRLTVTSTDTATGASFIFSQSAEQLKGFSQKLTVEQTNK